MHIYVSHGYIDDDNDPGGSSAGVTVSSNSVTVTSNSGSSIPSISRKRGKQLFYMCIHFFDLYDNLVMYDIGVKVRSRKDGDLTSNLLTIMSVLEEQADKRMEEREAKRMHLEASLEEKRREQERQHEERMQAMFFSFMQIMMAGSNMPVPQPSNPFYPPYSSHSHLPSFSLTPPIPPATSSTPPFLPPTSSTPHFCLLLLPPHHFYLLLLPTHHFHLLLLPTHYFHLLLLLHHTYLPLLPLHPSSHLHPLLCHSLPNELFSHGRKCMIDTSSL